MEDRYVEDFNKFKFDMGLETLMRLNKQLYAIWESKYKRDPFDLHKNLIILEQELYPFLFKLKNYKEDMNKLKDIKERTDKFLNRYQRIKNAGEEVSPVIIGQVFSGLAEYDGLLRIFMQELDLLMPERR